MEKALLYENFNRLDDQVLIPVIINDKDLR